MSTFPYDQAELYNLGMSISKALYNQTSAEDYLPNPTKLAQEMFNRGGWKRLEPAENKSVFDKTKPLTQAEKMAAYEEYWSPPETQTTNTYYRFVDGEAQIVQDAGGFLCVAMQLNDSVNVEFCKLSDKPSGSKGLDDARFLI